MKIGKAIKQLREQKGMSQKDLAKKVKRCTTIVSHWEQGVRYPHSSSLEALSKVLDVPIPYLILSSLEEDDFPKNKKILYKTMLQPLLRAVQEQVRTSLLLTVSEAVQVPHLHVFVTALVFLLNLHLHQLTSDFVTKA